MKHSKFFMMMFFVLSMFTANAQVKTYKLDNVKMTETDHKKLIKLLNEANATYDLETAKMVTKSYSKGDVGKLKLKSKNQGGNGQSRGFYKQVITYWVFSIENGNKDIEALLKKYNVRVLK